MKYKIEHLLAKYELTLNDAELAPEFVQAAKKFFEFTKSPDAKPEQIQQKDDELVELFNNNHNIIEVDNEDTVEAKKMTAKLKGEIEDYKANVEKLVTENAEMKAQLEAANREKAEREKRESDEQAERERLAAEENERVAAAEAEQQRAAAAAEAERIAAEQKKTSDFKTKLDILVEREVVDFEDLEALGVSNVGASRIEWNGLVFKRSGMLMSRKYAVYDHRN